MKNRKFILAAFSLVASTALAAFGKLTSDYATIVSIVVTAFHAADTLITRKSMDTK